jgi:hypothetical protein
VSPQGSSMTSLSAHQRKGGRTIAPGAIVLSNRVQSLLPICERSCMRQLAIDPSLQFRALAGRRTCERTHFLIPQPVPNL